MKDSITLKIGQQTLRVSPGENLLDRLLAEGYAVPWSCRGGYCQACVVQAAPGQAPDSATHMLKPEQQSAGWLLSCQCQITQDMDLRMHDPARDDVGGRVVASSRIGNVLILQIAPERPLRFKPGQHLLVWINSHIGRPYSVASLPGEPFLEFHIRLRPNGNFSEAAINLSVGDAVFLGVPTGTLQYDPEWQDRPLLLMCAGTGLAPLQSILRDALSRGHDAPVNLHHWSTADCYLGEHLGQLAEKHPSLTIHLRPRSALEADISQLRIASRRTMALICGDPGFVEYLRKPLFLAGLPGRQILDEAFFSRPQ